MAKSRGAILFIIGGGLLTVAGIGLAVYGSIKHYNRDEKTTRHTIFMIIGVLLIIAGIIMFVVGIVKSGKNKKEKLAEIGIELTPPELTEAASMQQPMQRESLPYGMYSPPMGQMGQSMYSPPMGQMGQPMYP